MQELLFLIDMPLLSQLRRTLTPSGPIVITTHHKPDADALGASLALHAYLSKLGYDCTVVTPSDYPTFLHWMKGHEHVLNFEKEAHKPQAIQLLEKATHLFCLDFSRLDRLHGMEKAARNSPAKKILIDHHLDKEHFAEAELYDPKAAATCELIYKLIEAEGHLHLIDEQMGACLYAGIMTDTGSFRHPSTTPDVHRMAAELLERGVHTNKVHRLIYDSNTEERMHFLGYILKDKLVVLPEHHTAYIAVSDQELNQYHSQTGDTEGFVNYALSIQGVRLAVLLIDRTEMIKLSFRSVEDLDVSTFAKEHFQGGGHKNAAGGKSNATLDATLQRLLALLPGFEALHHA